MPDENETGDGGRLDVTMADLEMCIEEGRELGEKLKRNLARARALEDRARAALEWTGDLRKRAEKLHNDHSADLSDLEGVLEAMRTGRAWE